MNAEEARTSESEPADTAAEPREVAGARASKAGPSEPVGYRIPNGSRWTVLWKGSASVGVAGLALAGLGYAVDARRFAFSYLFAFVCALSLALGSLFFILVERLTSAAWSITVRRLAELFASGFPALLVLFIPVVLCMGSLFPWLHEGGAAVAEPRESASAEVGNRSTTAVHAEEGDSVSHAGHAVPHHSDGSEATVSDQPRLPGGARPTLPAVEHPARSDVAASRGERRGLAHAE